MPKGEIEVNLLADGRVKIETGDMSGPIHSVADKFLDELQKLLGGPVEASKAKHAHSHTHHHHHNHDKAGRKH